MLTYATLLVKPNNVVLGLSQKKIVLIMTILTITMTKSSLLTPLNCSKAICRLESLTADWIIETNKQDQKIRSC